jgi:hypothetical protein
MDDPNTTDGLGYLAQLVGEGKKYRSVEELAKGYTNADNYIEVLKATHDDLKDEVNKRMSLEQFIEAQQDNKQNADASADPNPGGEVADTKAVPNVEAEPKVNESDLISRIKAELRADEQKSIAARNKDAVNERLLSLYSDAETVNREMAAKAESLGVSVQWLMDAAEKNPDAFYKLTDIEAPRKASTNVNPAVNTAGLPSAKDSRKTQEGTKAFYDELRKENLSKFLSADVQRQYMKDAMADPDKFFGRN